MKFFNLTHFAVVVLPLFRTVKAASDCLTDPTNPSCSNFVYGDSNIETDLTNLCRQMPFMPGCSVSSLCGNNTSIQNEPYCNKFSILADICAIDMPNMSDCKNYGKLCNNTNTVVPQCKTNTPIKNIPSSDSANAQIHSICDEMTMDGCEKCVKTTYLSKCDLLGVYSELCQAMPEMNQCKDWSQMCPGSASGKPDSTLPYCQMNGAKNSPPQMRMYFHTGFSDYVLFKEWVPRTAGQYAGTFIAIIAFGILYELLLTIRSKLEVSWSEENIDKLTQYSGRQFTIDSYRAIFQFVESSIAYLLMLVSMTFNVGLFFAVILGISIGTLLFSRFRTYGSTKRPCGC